MTEIQDLVSTLNKFMTVMTQQTSQQAVQLRSKQSTKELLQNNALHFDAFDENEETFESYIQRLEIFFQIKGLTDNDSETERMKGLFLINCLGAKHYNLISSLTSPERPDSKTYQELLILLNEHLCPKKNILTEQHKFLSRLQDGNESITSYVTALKQLACSAGFKSGCEDGKCTKSVITLMLRAQFIRGLRDLDIREKLLQLGEVSFEKALEIALAVEASKLDNQNIYTASTHQNDIHRIITTTSTTKNQLGTNRKNSSFRNDSSKNKNNKRLQRLGLLGVCLHCGRNNHETPNCRLVNELNCRYCHKDGHIEKVCIAKRIQEMQSADSNVKKVDEIDSELEYDVKRIINVLKNDGRDDRMMVNISLNGKQQRFECDSGSRVSIINNNDFRKLNLHIPICKTGVLFRSYTGQIFKPIGVCTLGISYEGRSCREDLYIVNLPKNAILGRDWIRKLKINLQHINLVSMNKPEADTKTIITSIKHRFSQVFEERVGKAPNFTCSLKLKDNSRPVYLKPRPVPYALRDAVENQLSKLEKEDIIEKVDQSEWGTPIVVIPKANGSVHICADYKVTVNQQLHDGRYPIPRIDDILNKMRNGNYFCTLDIYKAYLHLTVDPESAKIQTITTHKGTYIAKRLFFGIKTAPNEFHKFIDQVVQNLEGTVAYFDDIVVQGQTFEECKSRLIRVLEKLEQHNLHVNADKCKFFERKVQYLGHIISKDGIQKSPEKVKAILDAPRPSNIEGVRQFLGLVQYYSKFIKGASTLLNPLHQLLRKDKRFQWSQECEKAFTHIKEEIASDTVLVPYNPDLPVLLATDASPVGLSTVLSHRMPNNEERPIMFASRSLTAAERNYSQLDREATAVYWGCKKMFDYIFGRKFTLIIDNKPLMTILHPDKKLPLLTSSRMLRYAHFLSGFDYEILHKVSRNHCNADYLSRHPLPLKEENINVVDEDYTVQKETIQCITTDTITARDIEKETSNDEELSRLKEKLLNGEVADPEISLQDGIIFRGNRVVIPKKLQPAILQELHSTHVGIVRMKSLARNYCYWKNIDTDIESMVASCKECCENKKNPEKAPIHIWEIPKRNWQRVHMDYAGPFLNHHFLIVVDARSKWPEIYPIKSAPTTDSTIHHLREIFSHHGLPEILVSDNATIFKSAEFQGFCKRQGIRQRFIAPRNPSTNGQAERFCQTLKSKLRCMQFERGTLHEKLCALLFRYRATPLSTGLSPAQLMFGRNLRTKLDLLRPCEGDKNEAQQPIFSKHYIIGERIQSRNYIGSTLWKFGTVVERLGRLHYLVELDDGYVIKRHFNQLRPCEVAKDSTDYKTLPDTSIQRKQVGPNNRCDTVVKIPVKKTSRTLTFQNTNYNCSRQSPVTGNKMYSKKAYDTENALGSIPSGEGSSVTETSETSPEMSDTLSPTSSPISDTEKTRLIPNNEVSNPSRQTRPIPNNQESSPSMQQDEVSSPSRQPDTPKIRRSVRIRKPVQRMNL